MLRTRPRLSARIGFTALASLALTAGGLAVASGANAAAPADSGSASTAATTHSYRHGLVPTRSSQTAAAPQAPKAAAANLTYGGGVDGIGVTTGAEKVYVIFWGKQWGTQSTNSSGFATFSGDPKGMAPRLQALYKGLGTNNELWSGVMTQYCQGISAGSQTCPSGSAHVAYPTGGALAGVWEDTSASAPRQATFTQIGNEGVKAASHFGNTTAAANRNAQYVVVSPTGTHPDGFNTPSGQFCAWHDWNGDLGSSSSVGDVAVTNAPYVTDLGASCGQSFVNSGSAGNLDGVTIVMGHEYAETITDQNPAGGWTDSSGAENGDKCAWISSGAGASQNVSFGTGSFAMQSTWSNAVNGCQISHAIVS